MKKFKDSVLEILKEQFVDPWVYDELSKTIKREDKLIFKSSIENLKKHEIDKKTIDKIFNLILKDTREYKYLANDLSFINGSLKVIKVKVIASDKEINLESLLHRITVWIDSDFSQVIFSSRPVISSNDVYKGGILISMLYSYLFPLEYKLKLLKKDKLTFLNKEI